MGNPWEDVGKGKGLAKSWKTMKTFQNGALLYIYGRIHFWDKISGGRSWLRRKYLLNSEELKNLRQAWDHSGKVLLFWWESHGNRWGILQVFLKMVDPQVAMGWKILQFALTWMIWSTKTMESCIPFTSINASNSRSIIIRNYSQYIASGRKPWKKPGNPGPVEIYSPPEISTRPWQPRWVRWRC